MFEQTKFSKSQMARKNGRDEKGKIRKENEKGRGKGEGGKGLNWSRSEGMEQHAEKWQGNAELGRDIRYQIRRRQQGSKKTGGAAGFPLFILHYPPFTLLFHIHFTRLLLDAFDDWRSFYPQILTPTSRSQNEIYMINERREANLASWRGKGDVCKWAGIDGQLCWGGEEVGLRLGRHGNACQMGGNRK